MTYFLPFAYALTIHYSDVQNGKSRTRKVVFVWSIRDASKYSSLFSSLSTRQYVRLNSHMSAEQMKWISKPLINALERAPPSLEIAIRIFVTAGQKPDQMPLMNNNDSDSMYSINGPTATNADMPMPPRMLADFPSVQITSGRPDIPKMLKDEVAGASGRLSVTGAFRGVDVSLVTMTVEC